MEDFRISERRRIIFGTLQKIRAAAWCKASRRLIGMGIIKSQYYGDVYVISLRKRDCPSMNMHDTLSLPMNADGMSTCHMHIIYASIINSPVQFPDRSF